MNSEFESNPENDYYICEIIYENKEGISNTGNIIVRNCFH